MGSSILILTDSSDNYTTSRVLGVSKYVIKGAKVKPRNAATSTRLEVYYYVPVSLGLTQCIRYTKVNQLIDEPSNRLTS